MPFGGLTGHSLTSYRSATMLGRRSYISQAHQAKIPHRKRGSVASSRETIMKLANSLLAEEPVRHILLRR